MINPVARAFVQSHLAQNGWDALIKQKQFQYTYRNAFEDGVNIGRAFAEQLRQQKIQQHQVVAENAQHSFLSQLDYGETYLSVSEAQQYLMDIVKAFMLTYDFASMEYVETSLARKIVLDARLSTADKHNLRLFLVCYKSIYASKLKLGL